MTTFTVGSTSALYQALAKASGGDVIKLASGTYAPISLSETSGFNVAFSSKVTITSADPSKPAVLTGLELHNVSNLTVSNVVCDYDFKAGDPSYVTPFSVYGGANVTIANSTFDGDVANGVSAAANGYANGTGFAATATTNLTFTGNELSTFYRGLTVTDCTGVNVSGNEISDIRSDGMDFVEVHDVTIAGNHLHDFRTNEASGDHPDMIQFWTAGTNSPSTNIVIRGNVLDAGSGAWTQSIFLGNEVASQGQTGTAMYYRNVTIADNVIINGQYHGITLGQTIGGTISNNTVLHSDGNTPDGGDPVVEIPVINVAGQSTGIIITQNVTGQINGWSGQSGWVVTQNALVQDQDKNAAGYYGDIFISSSLTRQDGTLGPIALPGSIIDLLGAGASVTQIQLPNVGAVAALFQDSLDRFGCVRCHDFDAGLSLTHTGLLPIGTVFSWDFGDGSRASGREITHTFAKGGYYSVSLTVTLPGGATDTVVGEVGVQGRNLLALGADGALLASSYGTTTVLPGGDASGLHLGASGIAATVADAFISDLTRAHDFDILMQLKSDSLGSEGEVFRLNGGVVARIDDTGKLQVQTYDDAGHVIQLNSGAVSFDDLKSHFVDIKLTNGKLQLWVDHAMTSSAAFSGTMNSFGPTDLTFGNPWGGRNFDGDVDGFWVKIGERPGGAAKAALATNQSVDDLVFNHTDVPMHARASEAHTDPHALASGWDSDLFHTIQPMVTDHLW